MYYLYSNTNSRGSENELSQSNAVVDVYTWKGDVYKYIVPNNIVGYDWDVFGCILISLYCLL